MMNDPVKYIKRDDVVLWLTRKRYDQPERPAKWERVIDDILCEAAQHFMNAEPADVKPVLRGEWIIHDDEVFGTTFECSRCHVEGMVRGRYCYHCGAEMGNVKSPKDKLKWIDRSSGWNINLECPVCGTIVHETGYYYCPNCGTALRGHDDGSRH